MPIQHSNFNFCDIFQLVNNKKKILSTEPYVIVVLNKLRKVKTAIDANLHLVTY